MFPSSIPYSYQALHQQYAAIVLVLSISINLPPVTTWPHRGALLIPFRPPFTSIGCFLAYHRSNIPPIVDANTFSRAVSSGLRGDGIGLNITSTP